nr:MAG TPA: hypothetical protein [Caudoviricetes sp.]
MTILYTHWMYCQYKEMQNILRTCIDKTSEWWYSVVTIQNTETKCCDNAR